MKENENNYLQLSDKDLKEINEIIDKIIKEKKYFGNLSWDFIKDAILLYISNYKFRDKQEQKLEKKIFKIREIIEIALDFYKSIDNELYKRVADIILGKNPRIKFSIYKLSEIKDFEEMFQEPGFERFKKYVDEPCTPAIDNREVVYIPIGWDDSKEISKNIKKDECTIDDLYMLVHELAHTLDVFLENDDKEDYKIRNPYSDVFRESTAIGFENALTNYLLQNGIIKNKQEVDYSSVKRAIDILNKCIAVFPKLALANKKEENEIITIKDFYEVFDRVNLSNTLKSLMIKKMLYGNKHDVEVLDDSRYAFAGAIAPIVEELINKGEIKRLKEYIEATRNEHFKESLNALGITLDEDGMKKVEKYILGYFENLNKDLPTHEER